MDDSLKLIFTFVSAVTLIMALVLMVSILKRQGIRGVRGAFLTGVLYSLALVLAMSDPIDLGPAGIFDMRGLLIGTAAALFGPIVGVMTMLTGLAMRWGVGGAGLVPGLVGICVAFGAGLMWRNTIKYRDIAVWKKSIALGAMISLQMIAIFFAPVDLQPQLFKTLAPYTLVTNVVGAVLIHHLISVELTFLSRARTNKVEANTDHLTGLMNRRGLDAIYPNLKDGGKHARGRGLIYFDIDHFKGINDTFGHAVGDDVLKFVSDQISANLRPSDIFARLGGDEFVIVLSRIDASQAQCIAQRCRSVIGDGAFNHDGQRLHVTISVGAVWMLHHTEIDDILNQADEALYAAKTGGRNKVVFKSRKDMQPPINLALTS